MILRQVSPAIAAWILCIGVVLVGGRRHGPERTEPRRLDGPAVRRLIRDLAVLVAGGYLAMLAIVLVIGVWFVGLDVSALASAARGGLALAAVAVPCFLFLSWLRALRARSPSA